MATFRAQVIYITVRLFVVCLRSTQPKVIYQEEEEDSDEEKWQLV